MGSTEIWICVKGSSTSWVTSNFLQRKWLRGSQFEVIRWLTKQETLWLFKVDKPLTKYSDLYISTCMSCTGNNLFQEWFHRSLIIPVGDAPQQQQTIRHNKEAQSSIQMFAGHVTGTIGFVSSFPQFMRNMSIISILFTVFTSISSQVPTQGNSVPGKKLVAVIDCPVIPFNRRWAVLKDKEFAGSDIKKCLCLFCCQRPTSELSYTEEEIWNLELVCIENNR